MKVLKAKKINMTQIFDDGGIVHPVTLVVAVADSKGSETTKVADSQEFVLKDGDMVIVSGKSKGKGFQGAVKRHGFKGGSRSHGQKHSEREAGSIGGGGRAGGRVVKGMRMAGRMGNERITVKNLKIVKVLPETQEIFIQGAIPGRRGALITIRKVSPKA